MNIFRLKSSKYLCVLGIFLLVGTAVFLNCKKNKPIKIGFSAQLTGKQAELGVQERNGVQLAIEEINESGGVKGRQLSLVIHDDLGIPEEAHNGDLKLIKNDVVAIIGHATTNQTLASLEVINSSKVVMISPTVSTPELSEKDDYFFRTHPSFKDSSENFAEYIFKECNISNLAIIYDSDNKEYAKKYSSVFAERFQLLGGSVINEVGFSSKIRQGFSLILNELKESNVEGLLIVASDIDTALIAQRARIIGWQVPLFTSAWAQTETLISNGGQAVEGMKIEQAYNLASESKSLMDFKSRYKARFGNEPSFGAVYSYETALVLIDALKKTDGSKDGLKEALLQCDNFNGVIDKFTIDRYGDVERPWYLSTIENGKFIMGDRLTLINSKEE